MNTGDLFHAQDEIAVISMTCRFPGAHNVDEYWRNLQNGVESVTFFSEQELLDSGTDPAILSAASYVRASAVVEDIELFDAAFFGYTPSEAEIIDPQQRIFLECAWEALESAGYATDRENRRIGVYAGVGVNTYLIYNLCTNPAVIETAGWMQTIIGNEKDHLATRVSYKMNLTGPSVSVSTACSTSLVAIHLACQSLLNGECDLALAGGVSLRVPQKAGYLYQEGGIVSPDGHCRAFDAQAQGTLPGNGAGIVVLKRLIDALSDRDCIQAVIKGSAINNDGSAKLGYTAPSVEGQAEVIAEALALASAEPESIAYIEAHGTGTALGDPVEIRALTEAFRSKTEKRGFCAIGSVKTNIGHLDSAAGVASFIKTVLALKHRQIPPSLNFEQPNPRIDFAQSPFYVNTALTAWEAGSEPRRAGVSSLGLGGTNAHLILEEAPPTQPAEISRGSQLLVLSAKTETALQAAVTNLSQYLRGQSELDLADVAYTLQTGRKDFAYRRFLVCRERSDIETLSLPDDNQTFVSGEDDWPVIFLFPGQGMQHVDMARELYQSEATFRRQIDRCADLLKPMLGFDLRSILYPEEGQHAEVGEQIKQMLVAQPALFAIEYALAQLWIALGVRPRAMLGHSMGEYVAACVAGVLTLESALTLVATRGRLMQELPTGAMLSVALSAKDVQPYLSQHCSLAASNSATDCVLAGYPEAIGRVEQQLSEKGIFWRRLNIPRAAHSFMLEPILERFRIEVQRMTLAPPQIPYISNVTGTWITEQEATDPGYWVRHLRQTVRCAEGLQVLAGDGEKIMLELAPGRTLITLARRQAGNDARHILLPSLPHPQELEPDRAFFLQTCGRLWSQGIGLRWSEFSSAQERRRVLLPTYPFERKRHWIAPGRQSLLGVPSSAAGRKTELADWFSVPTWKRSVLPALSASSTQQACWLVLSDDMSLGQQLIQRLKQQGETAISVATGEQFQRIDEGIYILNPQRREDYANLLSELIASGNLPSHILHLWLVMPTNLEQAESESYESTQARCFYSLLFLLQAIGGENITQPLQIAVIANNLQEVTGGEARGPARATLLGLSQAIRYEYPNVAYRTIDITLPEIACEQERLVEQLISDCRTGQGDAVVAYRGAYRWVQDSEPMRLEESAGERSRLRERGVYLITGGLGGMGLNLAEYLARTVRARLVLAGRSVLPPREEWPQWLATHDEQEQTVNKIRRVQRLEELGAEVLTLQVDVTKAEEIQAMLTRIQSHFGSLHGLIHAAGIPSQGVMQLKQREEAARVLAPKVKGTLLLAEALKEKQLDFIILCSSLSSIVGGLGLSDYCASNAFLDTFAFYNTAKNGTLTISINWDVWQDVGMARDAGRLRILDRASVFEGGEISGGMQAQEGMLAFGRILRAAVTPQIIVSPQDIQALQKQAQRGLPLAESSEAPASNSAHARPASQTPYLAPQSPLEQQIATIWQRVLGIEGIGVNDNFFELGGDSVMIIQITRLLHETCQIALPMHLIFETSTIAKLAALIEQKQMELLEGERMAELIARVSQMSEEDVLLQLGKDLLNQES